jgi:hypothetical protein
MKIMYHCEASRFSFCGTLCKGLMERNDHSQEDSDWYREEGPFTALVVESTALGQKKEETAAC